jgi:hypothetical protein
MRLEDALSSLEALHGAQARPPVGDILGFVLWKTVDYLVNDSARRQAFDLLRATVGLIAAHMLPALLEALVRLSVFSVAPLENAGKLRQVAGIPIEEFAEDLESIRGLPYTAAKKAPGFRAPPTSYGA